jgi:histidine triad (HIT) family protein
MSCIFCKIANHEIPSDIQFEDENLLAFNDIAPQTPIHILIIPKKHIASINDLQEKDANLAGSILLLAKHLAQKLDLSSYRLVTNTGEDAGQTVKHLHFHLLGGKKLGGIN